MTRAAQEYVLIERHSQPGRNGVTMWRLVFYSLATGDICEMTLDSSYRNFRRSGWEHVVEDPSPWGAYTDLRRTQRRTRQDRPVLTADSPARLVWRSRDLDQAWQLVEDDQRERNPTAFERLFQ